MLSPPPPPRVTGGGGSAAGVRYLLACAQAWHAQAEVCAGQMSAVSTGLRMAMFGSGKHVDVESVAPDAPRVSAALEEVRREYPPPPTASRRRPWTPPLWRRRGSRAPRIPLAGALLKGGGGCVAHPLTLGPPVPSNLHKCYPAPAPPRHGQFDRHVGHSPPTLRNFLQHCLYFIRGMLCPPTCLRYFLQHCLYFLGMLCPLTCYTAD